MIDKYKDILTDNLNEMVWKRLRAFRDREFSKKRICEVQDIPEDRFRNYRKSIIKQADQIGMCIHQAQQYFHAAREVDLATKPNLLYYGIVALSRALTLLCLSGEYSLDYLRKKKRHIDHGLRLEAGGFESTSIESTTQKILDSVSCRVNERKVEDSENQDPGVVQPWGAFALFWQCVEPTSFRVEVKIEDQIKNVVIEDNCIMQSEHRNNIYSASFKKKYSILELVSGLPDLYHFIVDLDIDSNLKPGKVRQHKVTGCGAKRTTEGIQDFGNIDESLDFSIDHLSTIDQQRIMDHFRELNPNIKLILDLGRVSDNSILLNIRAMHRHDVEMQYGKLPPICQDMYCNHYFIVDQTKHILEPVAYYMLTYCLGMLCRYYPDRWIPLISKKYELREFLSNMMEIIYRRFPLLILNQMLGVHHYIHS